MKKMILNGVSVILMIIGAFFLFGSLYSIFNYNPAEGLLFQIYGLVCFFGSLGVQYVVFKE